MKCTTVQSWLFRKIDGELSDSENAELDAHLEDCAACSRGYRLLMLPQRIAQTDRAPEPSPFFFQKLSRRIEGETQSSAGWQIFWKLARPMIPALAGITLALLSLFAYVQIHIPEAQLFEDYNLAFISEDQPHRMLVEDQGDITYESVLNAIFEQESGYRRNHNLK